MAARHSSNRRRRPQPGRVGNITIARGIEVGHIFQLGTKYSEAMNAAIVNEAGKNQIMVMGCYGIGISRVVAAAIEQGHDERGIIWPNELAPFQVAICPMNMYKSDRLVDTVEKVYRELTEAGIEVLLDDRKVRAGFMFSDMELIGIPHRIVIGDRGLDSGTVEYQAAPTTTARKCLFQNWSVLSKPNWRKTGPIPANKKGRPGALFLTCWCTPLAHQREHRFDRAALRATPIFRHVFPAGTRGNAVTRVTQLLVVNMSTGFAFVSSEFCHCLILGCNDV